MSSVGGQVGNFALNQRRVKRRSHENFSAESQLIIGVEGASDLLETYVSAMTMVYVKVVAHRSDSVCSKQDISLSTGPVFEIESNPVIIGFSAGDLLVEMYPILWDVL